MLPVDREGLAYNFEVGEFHTLLVNPMFGCIVVLRVQREEMMFTTVSDIPPKISKKSRLQDS